MVQLSLQESILDRFCEGNNFGIFEILRNWSKMMWFSFGVLKKCTKHIFKTFFKLSYPSALQKVKIFCKKKRFYEPNPFSFTPLHFFDFCSFFSISEGRIDRNNRGNRVKWSKSAMKVHYSLVNYTWEQTGITNSPLISDPLGPKILEKTTFLTTWSFFGPFWDFATGI